jgi:hypothetical protein
MFFAYYLLMAMAIHKAYLNKSRVQISRLNGFRFTCMFLTYETNYSGLSKTNESFIINCINKRHKLSAWDRSGLSYTIHLSLPFVISPLFLPVQSINYSDNVIYPFLPYFVYWAFIYI